MIKNLVKTLMFGLLISAHANAASLTITGPDEVTENFSFQLLITGNFGGEGLISGGVRLFYDPALVELDDITRHLGDPMLSCPGSVDCPVDPSGAATIVWGSFVSDLIGVSDPPALMATLTFTATGSGTAVFSMASADDLTGGWWGPGWSPIDIPVFGTFAVDINPNQCTGGDGDNATLGVSVMSDFTCAARVSIDVHGATMVIGPDGHLHLTAPSTGFQSGFKVLEDGSLTVTSADPCPFCSP